MTLTSVYDVSEISYVVVNKAVQKQYCAIKPEVDNPRSRPLEPEIIVSQLVVNMATKFQQLPLYFRIK